MSVNMSSRVQARGDGFEVLYRYSVERMLLRNVRGYQLTIQGVGKEDARHSRNKRDKFFLLMLHRYLSTGFREYPLAIPYLDFFK